MTGVRLDPRGRLRWFRAVPPPGMSSLNPPLEGTKPTAPRSVEPVRTSDPAGLPWSGWFREEELGFSLEPTSDEGPGYAACRRTSCGTPNGCGRHPTPMTTWRPGRGRGLAVMSPLHVEATSYRGRPVYFEVLPPAFVATNGTSSVTGPSSILTRPNLSLLLNNRSRSGASAAGLAKSSGWAGATVVGPFESPGSFFVNLLVWMLRASHVGGLFEWVLFMIGLAQALFLAALAWLFYIAIEPFVRRYWPQTLISWTRVAQRPTSGIPKSAGIFSSAPPPV